LYFPKIKILDTLGIDSSSFGKMSGVALKDVGSGLRKCMI
jgi:hypothetical protein